VKTKNRKHFCGSPEKICFLNLTNKTLRAHLNERQYITLQLLLLLLQVHRQVKLSVLAVLHRKRMNQEKTGMVLYLR
jgi:hypothetical protein